jgi:lipopolysaccharide export system protein LptA
MLQCLVREGINEVSLGCFFARLYQLGIGLSLFFLLLPGGLLAQQNVPSPKRDTAAKTIIIDHSRSFYFAHTDSGDYNRFIDSVVMRQGTDTLYCDSAYLNTNTKNFEAFGDVRIAQAAGTHAQSDYLKYTSGKKLAYMRGNVSLTDGKNKLWCEELTYDVGTKTAVYDKMGTLQSDTTTVSSNSGTYNVNTKDAVFQGNVLVTDPQYQIRSEDMGYNTETKNVRFFAPSVVTSDSGRSVLRTCSGTYDSKNRIADFTTHSSILDHDQYIEGDSLYYNKVSGFGRAKGHVISIDTSNHSTIYCGYAEYHHRQRSILATIKPVFKQMNGKDSLFMRADTFYSAPIAKIARTKKDTTPAIAMQDSAKKAATGNGRSRRKIAKKEYASTSIAIADTAEADTTAPRYFVGYHHVKVFSDSLQAKCDSIVYTQSDSTIRLIYAPVAWAHNSQITGDTILLHLDSGKLHDIYVPNNAFVASRSGPIKAQLFDQVQGKTLKAWFVNNEIDWLTVFPSGECIYYPRDEKGAYEGVDEGKGERISVFFQGNNIKFIKFLQDVHQTLTPLDKADLPNMKLSRFKWLSGLRPKSRAELFE